MKIRVVNLRGHAVGLPAPLNNLAPREVRVADLHAADLERVSSALVQMQRAGYVDFDAYNDMAESERQLDTEFMTTQDILSTTRMVHVPTVSVSRVTLSPGQGPQPMFNNALAALVFTPGSGTDQAYHLYKIPYSYVGEPTIHIHWTKSTNAVESGRHVRWRVSYTVFDGTTMVGNAAPTIVEYEGTYADGGTTTRVVYRSPNLAMTGFVAGYYLSMFIQAIAPTGLALTADPALVSLDLMFRSTINRGD